MLQKQHCGVFLLIHGRTLPFIRPQTSRGGFCPANPLVRSPRTLLPCSASDGMYLKAPQRRTHLTDYRVGKGEAQEDQVTAAIEKVTSQLPSSAFLGLALASMGVSLGLHFSGRKHE